MKFQSGILGVIVVVIALIGTIFGGYILNVNSETTVTTDYSSITDVSSLYSYTETPDYIEYNPAKNFTGYKLSNGSGSGISYTESTTMNQYLMGSESSTVSDINIGNLMDWMTTPQLGGGYHYIVPYQRQVSGNGFDYVGFYDVNRTSTFPSKGIHVIDLLTYLENIAPANTDRITINIPQNSDVNFAYTGSSVGSALVINGSAYRLWSGYINGTLNADLSTCTYYRNYQISLSFDKGGSDYTVNFGNQQSFTLSRTSTNSDYFSLVESTPNVVSYHNEQGSRYVISTYPYPYYNGGNDAIQVVYSYDTIYHYMNPSQGVSINNPSNLVTTDWTNSKTNQEMDILFGVTGVSNSNTIRLPSNDTISLRYDDITNYVRVNSGSWVDVGSWDHFLLTINAHQGKVTVTPVIDFINFQTYSLADYTYDIGSITVAPFTKLFWSSTSDSYKFSVTSTMVEVTSKLFMVDPTLNIKDYFPLDEGFKLEMSSFTKLGDSITINGNTYYGDSNGNTIESTGYVYFPDSDESIKLGTMYVIEDDVDGHTYVQSAEWGSSRIDLGETTTSVISASGVWFFTNQLYEGKIVDAEHYVWEWANNLTSMQSIMIWLAFIIIGSLVARRFFDFTMLDLAIVIASSVILYSILGVF